jgi:hypothetical protein
VHIYPQMPNSIKNGLCANVAHFSSSNSYSNLRLGWGAYESLTEKSSLLVIVTDDRGDNIKIYFKEVRCKGVN